MKVISTLLAIALIAVSGFAFHLWRNAEAGQKQIAALTLKLEGRQAQPAATVMQPAQPAVVAASPAVAAAQSSAPAARPAVPSVLPEIAAIRAQMASPEGLARRRQTTRMLMANSNPDIGEALGMTPAEVDKLLDMLAQHQENTSVVFDSAAAGNSQATPQERSAALQKIQQANNAELQATLGSKYAKWQDYRETLGAYQQRRDLRAVLDAAGAPMTQTQDRALIAALSAEQRSISQETRNAATQGRSFAEVMTRYAPEKRQRLLDAAAPHLSPQQLEGYKGMLERAAAQEQTILGPMRAIPEAAAAGAAR